MKMKVTAAVIPVAGVGSRALPLTSAIEKCLLPVYAGSASRPLVDFMVEDCIRAGIERIIFVTSDRGKSQLTDYFGTLNSHVREQLAGLGKSDAIDNEEHRRANYTVSFEYVLQPAGRYGTALPLFLSRDLLKGEEHFVMMGGDDFVYHPDGTSELRLAIESWNKSGCDNTIMGNHVSREEAQKYGVLQVDDNGRLLSIDEKPPLERIPEYPVVNISRHLLSDSIWEFIDREMHKDRGSAEHYITYVITDAITAGQTFNVHSVTGTYLDGGNYDGLLHASNYVAAHMPQF